MFLVLVTNNDENKEIFWDVYNKEVKIIRENPFAILRWKDIQKGNTLWAI